METAMNGTRYYSITEICRKLSICRPTAYKLINSGNLEALKVGSSWRISEKALQDFTAKMQ